MVQLPRVFEDELLYSVLSRYSERCRYPRVGQVTRDMFGVETRAAVIEFPSALSTIAMRAMGGPHDRAVQELLWDRTLLPYHAAFLPRERHDRLIQAMQAGGRAALSIPFLTGRLNSKVTRPRFLRACNLCLQDDDAHRERYWRRCHQLPGVLVCPTHCHWLVDTDVRLGGNRRVDRYHLPPSPEALPSERTDRIPGHLLDIASESAWVLSHYRGQWADRRVQLKAILAGKRLLNPNGTVRIPALTEAMWTTYRPDDLASLGVPHDFTLEWAVRLARGKAFGQPLHYLLVLIAAGATAADLFAAKGVETVTVAKSVTQRCRNPVRTHRTEPDVQLVKLCRRGSIQRCPKCGYTYWLSSGSAARIRVLDHGPVWRHELRIALARHLDVAATARLLGTNASTVKVEAARLDALPPSWRLSDGEAHAAEPKAPKRDAYRNAWLELVREHRGDGVTALRDRAPNLHQHLYRCDRGWLVRNSPRPRLHNNGRSYDWAERDSRLERLVYETAKIIGAENPDPRVTKKALMEAIGVTARTLAHLPKTCRAISASKTFRAGRRT